MIDERVRTCLGINAISKSADATGSVCWSSHCSSCAPATNHRVILLGVVIHEGVVIGTVNPIVDAADEATGELLGVGLPNLLQMGTPVDGLEVGLSLVGLDQMLNTTVSTSKESNLFDQSGHVQGVPMQLHVVVTSQHFRNSKESSTQSCFAQPILSNCGSADDNDSVSLNQPLQLANALWLLVVLTIDARFLGSDPDGDQPVSQLANGCFLDAP